MRALAAICLALAALIPSGAQAREAAPVPGTITTLADDPGGPSPVDAVFDEAVQRALTDAHFMVLPGTGHGRYVARFSVTHRGLGAVRTRATGQPAQAGDASVSVTLPSRKSDLQELAEVRLEVRIVQRADEKTVWHGGAVTTAIDGTASGQPSAVARKLADAIFRQYPVSHDTPVGVP